MRRTKTRTWHSLRICYVQANRNTVLWSPVWRYIWIHKNNNLDSVRLLCKANPKNVKSSLTTHRICNISPNRKIVPFWLPCQSLKVLDLADLLNREPCQLPFERVCYAWGNPRPFWRHYWICIISQYDIKNFASFRCGVTGISNFENLSRSWAWRHSLHHEPLFIDCSVGANIGGSETLLCSYKQSVCRLEGIKLLLFDYLIHAVSNFSGMHAHAYVQMRGRQHWYRVGS